MIVKILKCSHGTGSWYYNLVGQNIKVKKARDKKYFQVQGQDIGYLLSKDDVKVVSQS